MTDPLDDRAALVAVEVELRGLRDALLAAESARAEDIATTHPTHRLSATNLVHYLEPRRHDVRKLQALLGALGLSSLGRSEPCVLAVLAVLCRLNGNTAPEHAAGVGVAAGQELLAANAEELLGRSSGDRSCRIMVTMPTEAADDARLASEMVATGMNLIRVNCAHDDPEVWARMITTVRSSAEEAGRTCVVAMDLAGPKLRTGPLQPGPRVVRVAPRREALGSVRSPALVRLSTTDHVHEAARHDNVVDLPVIESDWLSRRSVGDRVELRDGRGARRTWTIVVVGPRCCVGTAMQTAYVVSGLELTCRMVHGDDVAAVGELPEREQSHHIDHGDRLILTRSLEPAEPTERGQTHVIGCTLLEVFERVHLGHQVWLDDGKIGGRVDCVADDHIELVVTNVRPGGARLRAGKGSTCRTRTFVWAR